MNDETGATPDARWASLLRESGLRATPGRIAALAFVDAHPHSSAAAVYEALREEMVSTSLQAAHNIVGDLTTRGLLRRIELPEAGSAQYETRVDDNHHHVQCVSCGRVEDVDCATGYAPCLQPSSSHGMRILVSDVVFRGICGDCEQAELDDLA